MNVIAAYRFVWHVLHAQQGNGKQQGKLMCGVNMKQSIELELPEPLSLNRAYRTYKGRMLISREGREYKKAVAWIVRAANVSFGKARIRIVTEVHFGSKRRRDLDNTQKSQNDALADGGLYDDDSQIDELVVIRMEIDRDNPRAIVTVTEL